MKKIVSFILLLGLFIPSLNVHPNGEEEITLYIGSNQAIVQNQIIKIDEDPQVVPIIQNSTTFVPVRFISENFHLKVDYIDSTQTVTLNGNQLNASFAINSNIITINGKEIKIDSANENTITLLYRNRAYLPIRAISEAIGKQVFYDRGLILIGDSLSNIDPKKDKEFLDEKISKLTNLLTVGDQDTLLKLLEKNNVNQNYLYKSAGGGSAMVMENSAVATPSAPLLEDKSYSETNVQVEGVDEADIVKTDGKYIYQINEDKIVIIKADPITQMSVTSMIKDDQQRIHPLELYIDNDKLTVISNVTNQSSVIYDSAVSSKRMIMPRRYDQYTNCSVYNIKNPSQPILERVFEIEGSYISSRKIENQIYMVTNEYIYFNGGKEDLFTPQYKEQADTTYQEIALKDIYYFPDFKENNYVTISSIDCTAPDKKANTTTFLGAGQNIYSSTEHLYIATTKYDKEATTEIYKFSLNKGEITYLAKESVPGTIINQFSMDEYDGNFRIATTQYQTNQQTNSIYILDSVMQKRGSITGIAPGENIYSTRFMGNRGYMVTFKLVDPLFVLDLSDIDHPTILGKLKIPGYSNYIHPVDENHIIGFGKDSEEYNGGAFYQGMKMALFDITDVNNPIEKFVEKIGDRGTSSPLLSDHKALLYDADKGLLAFPVTVYTIDSKTSITQYGNFEFNGAYVYNFGIDTGFSLKGRISHLTSEDYLKAGSSFDYKKSIDRILYIGENLFTTSLNTIQAHKIENLEFINSIEIK